MVKTCFVIALTALLAAGCNKSNPNYCPGNPDNNCTETDGGSDGASACGSNADCTGAGAMVCDTQLAPHECVQCTTGDQTACSGTTPVCVADSCGACTMDSQCTDSGVCMPDGSCAVAADVLYAGPSGTGSDCTEMMPCDLPTAVGKVSGTQTIVHLDAGTYLENNTLELQNTLTLIGRGATVNRNGGGNGATISIDPDAVVTLDYLDVTGGDGLAGYGVDCGGATVTLNQVTIDTNQGVGVNASTGTTLTMSRSSVSGNTGGGISINAAEFALTNNFIVGNGGGTSALGGISINAITTAGTHQIDFNTIAGNFGPATVNTGVSCNTVIMALLFDSNIIYGNAVSEGGVQIGGSANCTTTYSDIGPDTATGTGNINMDPMYVNAAQTDFHLVAGSPCQNVADSAATLTVDYDGDARPQGSGYDIGADEIKEP